MSKKLRIGMLAIAVCMLAMEHVYGQASVLGNSGATGQYLGWDNGTTIPLEIRHDRGDEPIEFYTTGDAISEMWLTPTLQNFVFNTYTSDVSGNLGVGPGFSMTSPPLARLHLNATTNTLTTIPGYRDWMRTGTLATEGRDAMYIGLKNEDFNSAFHNPAVINWSSNVGFLDPLRFIFTCNPLGPGASATGEGLEVARMYMNGVTGNEGYFGIGDFNVAAAQPAERLDVLNGRVRVRELPDVANHAPTFTSVVVVDNAATPSGERGVLKWADITDLVPNDCEWTMNNAAPHHVYTAVGTAPACPDDAEAVAVGLSLAPGTTPPAKFSTVTRDFATAVQVTNTTPVNDVRGLQLDISNAVVNNIGIEARIDNPNQLIPLNVGARFNLTGPVTRTRGVQAISSGGTFRCYAGDFISHDIVAGPNNEVFGVNGLVTAGTIAANTTLSAGANGNAQSGARFNMGVRGLAIASAANNTQNGSNHFGVWGYATAQPPVMNSDSCTGSTFNQFAAGVYGESRIYRCPSDPNFATNHWAGFFRGDVNVTGEGYIPQIWITSDAQFKTNVEEIANATDLLSQLQPKTYDFIPQEHPDLTLIGTGQYGLIAQELQTVIPSLVKSKMVPAATDSSGNIVAAETSHLVINYDGLIPILIAGHKEQDAVIEAQQATIAEQDSAIEANSTQMEDLLTRMDQLEQLLALCCQNSLDPDQRNMLDDPTRINDPANDRNLRIQPNPFNEQTTVYYNLERNGRMQLMANSSDGKQLRVLQEAQMEAGQYQYEWYTADLSAGIYYVTLLLDGEPIVKKAVKVN